MFESEYIAAPARTVKFPEEYLERVQRTHEVGGYGSIGWADIYPFMGICKFDWCVAYTSNQTTAVGKLGTGEGWKSWQLHLKCEEFVKRYRLLGRDIFGVNRFLVIETWALFYGELTFENMHAGMDMIGREMKQKRICCAHTPQQSLRVCSISSHRFVFPESWFHYSFNILIANYVFRICVVSSSIV